MDYRRYTLYNVLGGIGWIWSVLFIGYFLGRYIPGIDRHIEPVILTVVFLSLLPGIIGWFRAKEIVMPFTLPPLPYANDALEPHIDAHTMEIHHDKHHQAYVNNLNAAIEKAPELAGKSLDDLMRGINSVPEAVRDRRAQQRRRPLESLACSGRSWAARSKGGEPTGKLADAIKSAFGDFSKFKEQFAAAGGGPLRLGLGVARQRRRQAVDHQHAEPGQSAHGRQDRDPRPRRLGARVLPQVPEQAARLHRRVVERRELGRGRRNDIGA